MDFYPRTTNYEYTDGSSGLTLLAQHAAGGGVSWVAALRVGNATFRGGNFPTARQALEDLAQEAPGRYTEKLRSLAAAARWGGA